MNKKVREIKVCCNRIKNSTISRRKFVVLEKVSPFLKSFLFYLKKEGLILDLKKKEKKWLVELKISEKLLNFDFHLGLKGRKVKRKNVSVMPHYSTGKVLGYSDKIKKLLPLEEMYSLQLGGVILGRLILE